MAEPETRSPSGLAMVLAAVAVVALVLIAVVIWLRPWPGRLALPRPAAPSAPPIPNAPRLPERPHLPAPIPMPK